MKKCKFCNSEIKNKKARKYCSEKCRIDNKAKKNNKNITEKECTECMKKFSVQPKHAIQKTCSEKCRKDRERRMSLKEKRCVICEEDFTTSGGTNVCSTECKHKRDSKKVERSCIVCKETFYTYPSRIKREASMKCCSMECYRESRRTGKSSNCSCDECGSRFYKAPSLQKKHNNNFCSHQCMGKYYSDNMLFAGENSGSYIGSYDSHKKYYGEDWRKQRRIARERDNYTCQKCGIHEDDYGMEMSVHHIIPFVIFDSSEDANKLDNLKCLCEPCHRLEHSGDNNPKNYKIKYKEFMI